MGVDGGVEGWKLHASPIVTYSEWLYTTYSLKLFTYQLSLLILNNMTI